MQLCGSNCTKLIAGVTPSGRSSQSSASGASASPVYFPSPTAAAGSWLCTAPVWRHIPASFCLSGSSLLRSRTQAHSLCPRMLPLLPELAAQALLTEGLSTALCRVAIPVSLSGRPLGLPFSCSFSVTLVSIIV